MIQWRVVFVFMAIFFFCSSYADVKRVDAFYQALSALESRHGGRLGLYAIDTNTMHTYQFRADERFPFQSTFKVFVAAAFLRDQTSNHTPKDEWVKYAQSDLVYWSPITEQHIKTGMTTYALCDASLRYSDNTATNLLIDKMGGVDAINRFIHALGDSSFRLNNLEPNLNSDSKRLEDTSTPRAMAQDLQRIAFGDVLPLQARDQLLDWMKHNTTGAARIRAGVPKNWVVADKTGSGDFGVTNDFAVLWPPKRAPIVVAIYFASNTPSDLPQDRILADATRHLVSTIMRFYR